MANEFKIKKGLIVTGASGGTVVDIQGSQGQLFSVTDDLSGSIFAVSDISGVPIFDVNSSGVSYFDGNVTIKGTGTKLQWERASDNAAGIVYLTKTEDLGSNGSAKLHGYDGITFTTAGTETERMRITSAGGISFGSGGTAYGTSGQILKSNANASPTWVDASTVIGGPYVTIATAQTITGQKTFSNTILGNASSAYLLRNDGSGLTTQRDSGTVAYPYAISSTTAGLFAATDNANSILTLGRHPGNYYSQLGFSSNGKLYYRKFSNVAINTTQAWETIAYSSDLGNYLPLAGGALSGDVSITTEGKYYQSAGPFGWGNSGTLGVRVGTDSLSGVIDFRRWLGSGTSHHSVAVRQVVGGSGRYGLGFLANDLSTNSVATTARMYIDPNNGYVGIGTTSPATKIHVLGSTISKTWSPNGSTIAIFENAFTNRSFVTIAAKSTGQSELWFADESSETVGRVRYDHTVDALSLWTSNAQKLTVASSGNVGIGQTNPASYKLDVTGNGRFTSTVTATDFIGTSDRRKKENLLEYKPRYLDTVYKTGNFIGDTQERVFLVAQDVEKFAPEFVRTDKDGMLAVSYTDLHSAEIAYLKEENKALKSKLKLIMNKLGL